MWPYSTATKEQIQFLGDRL